ncbi:MAG TPA: V-type ATP synthase subunit E family protein [Syntrophorhabdaceae bacterium]|nr:V-type ATP synthase subunit E family protein [Syntrophorhabdaceae bacterium]HOL04984.1 V-type ATP synthase subunit E family protein [Syntrophorhabdaceae bacterium]HON85783.1 V-type ATP synthase subunit E family protein [Syntrophorhabdaceae bacterium]HOT41981.1 V-type ATP synthase subunit E family protein [Syntrophorhabdaceae bacterium]HPC66570.1 V-type ATP synthase subunit E family protein [Syntrophorhabdaceae bacterium]
MGIEKISEAVLSEAEKEAKNIVETAKKNARLLVEKRKREIDEEIERLYKARTSSISEDFNRKLIQYRGMAGKQILEKRNKLVDAIFEKAKDRVLNLPADRYKSLMASILEKIAGDSTGRVCVHRDDMAIFREIVSQINEKRTEGNKISLDESSTLTERGGFVFVADNYEVDQTLDMLFKDIKKDMLPSMAKELFSHQDIK